MRYERELELEAPGTESDSVPGPAAYLTWLQAHSKAS